MTQDPTTSGARPSHAPELRAAARHIGRRRFLTATGAAAALAFAVGVPGAGTAAAAELDGAQLTDDPFTLGVASGDPHPDSVLLWTRLAPVPYQADGGLPARRVTVEWEIALDARFRSVVRRGRATAHPEFHHTVHVEAGGLAPGRVYHYRFRAGRFVSPAGRTRTAPAARSRAATSPSASSPASATTRATTPPTGTSRRRTSTSSSTSATTSTSTP